jgi:hypothetical protein
MDSVSEVKILKYMEDVKTPISEASPRRIEGYEGVDWVKTSGGFFCFFFV